MQDLLNAALETFALAKTEAGNLGLKLFTDAIGRTLPTSMAGARFVGGNNVQWLGTDNRELSASGYTNHGTAFSIINYILSTAAPIPWAAYKVDKQDNRAAKIPKHPLVDLLYRPNPRQSWADFKMQCEGSYQVRGECFIRRVRPAAGSKAGKTAELWCLIGRVELLPTENLGEFDTPTGYRHYDALTSGYTDYPAEEILHLKTYNPDNPHRGLSPIQAGIDAVTASKAGLVSRVKQYQNQGPPGILFDEATDANWTQDQASGIQRFFNSFRIGGRREGNLPIITGKLGYLKLGIDPVDMAVLEAIPHDKDAIADLYRFPGELLNGSKGTTFNNAEAAGRALYSRCVIPLETVMRDGINRWIGPEYDDGVYLDFDVSRIPELQDDKKAQAEWLDKAWWVPVKKKQEMMGFEADWDGPAFVLPSTYIASADLAGVPLAADAAGGADALNN